MSLRTFVALTVLAWALAVPVQAMVVKPTDLRTLISSARAIVHGRVVATRAQSSDRTRIETVVTLEANGYLKGDLGRVVSFVVPGGTLGRYRTVVSGAPRFAEGDEVVLFLGARGPAMPYIVRLSEGVFRVQHDGRTGEALVARQPLTGRSPQWQPVVRGGPQTGPLPLSSFSSLVRGMVEGAR